MQRKREVTKSVATDSMAETSPNISSHLQYRDQTWFFMPEAAVFNTSQGTWRMLMH